jgi:O-antigen/teichoic acid export membrane protein
VTGATRAQQRVEALEAEAATDAAPPATGASTPRRVLRNAGVAWVGEVLAKASSIAFFAVMARELGTATFGHFIFALSLTTVLVLVAGLGTDSLLEREVARDHARAADYVASVTGLKAITIALLLGAAAVVVNIAGYPADARAAVYLVGLGVGVEHLSKTRYAAFMAHERMRYMSLSIIVQRFLTAAVGVVVLVGGGGLVAASMVFLGGALAGFAMAELSLRRSLGVKPRGLGRARWLALVRAGFPIGLSAMLFTILLKLDATLLSLLTRHGHQAEVGYYGAAYRIVEGTMFLSWYFGAAIMPWVARRSGADRNLSRGYERSLKALTALLLPLAVAFAVLARPVVELLFGSSYAEAVLPLRLLSATIVLYGINYLASTFFIARDRPGDWTRLLCLVVAENVLLNILLIPRYGANATAFNAALSGLLLAAMGIWSARRLVGAIRFSCSLASPLVGGTAMVATMLPLVSKPVVSLVVGGLAYVLCFAAAERFLFPADRALWGGLFSRAHAGAR